METPPKTPAVSNVIQIAANSSGPLSYLNTQLEDIPPRGTPIHVEYEIPSGDGGTDSVRGILNGMSS